MLISLWSTLSLMADAWWRAIRPGELHRWGAWRQLVAVAVNLDCRGINKLEDAGVLDVKIREVGFPNAVKILTRGMLLAYVVVMNVFLSKRSIAAGHMLVSHILVSYCPHSKSRSCHRAFRRGGNFRPLTPSQDLVLIRILRRSHQARSYARTALTSQRTSMEFAQVTGSHEDSWKGSKLLPLG